MSLFGARAPLRTCTRPSGCATRGPGGRCLSLYTSFCSARSRAFVPRCTLRLLCSSPPAHPPNQCVTASCYAFLRSPPPPPPDLARHSSLHVRHTYAGRRSDCSDAKGSCRCNRPSSTSGSGSPCAIASRHASMRVLVNLRTPHATHAAHAPRTNPTAQTMRAAHASDARTHASYTHADTHARQQSSRSRTHTRASTHGGMHACAQRRIRAEECTHVRTRTQQIHGSCARIASTP